MPIADSHLERLQLRKLLQCIITKDHEQIEKLVKYGVHNLINYNDPDNGITPLILAGKENSPETLQVLLDVGASPDIVDFEGKTALMRAAEDGNTQTFKILSDAGANKNMVDLKGKSVLFHCISPTDRHLECLIMALDKRTHVNKQDCNGESPLYFACKNAKENDKFILELMNNNADVNLAANNGRTPLFEACASGNAKVVVKAIRMGGNLDIVDKTGRTPVHEAGRNGHLDVLVALSGFGVEFDAYDKLEKNPLHLAAANDEMCCKFLGQRGCNVKVKDSEGRLPRSVATEEGKKACVKELRKLEKASGKAVKNTEPWALRLYDWTATLEEDLTVRFIEMGQYLAVEAERLRQLEIEEAAMNEQDATIDPATAISEATEQVSPRASSEKSTSSRRSGSKKKKKGKKKRDGSNTSRSSEPPPLARLLREDFENVLQSLGAPYDEVIMKQLVKLHEKTGDGSIDWKEFLSGKKYVNKTYLMSAFAGKKGKKKKGGKGGKKKKTKIPMAICTLPQEAIFRRADGGPPIMYIPKQTYVTDTSYEVLIERDTTNEETFSPPETPQNRFTADAPPFHPLQDDSMWYMHLPSRQYISFHAAAKHGDLASIRLALAEGYPVDTRDKFYKTPLMIAAHSGNLDSAIALIQFGADLNAKDNFRWTSLHHAAHSGMIDMVELLLRNGAVLDAKALNGATPIFRAIECSRLNVIEYIASQGAKLILETRKGNNAYDVALAWADPRVVDFVYGKWSLAQESADKKKNKGSAKGKRPKTASSVGSASRNKRATSATPPAAAARLPGSRSRGGQRSIMGDMLDQAHPLDVAVAAEDLRFCPKFPWLPMPTRAERLAKLAEARERYGWDHGLPGIPLQPLDRHLAERFKDVEAEAA